MAATAGTSGFGTLLKIGNGATVEVFTTIAEVRNISGPGLSLETIEATHMESPSGYREYLPSFKEPGEVSFDLNFLPSNTQHKGLKADMDARTKRNFKLVWPNTAGTTWSFSGYITSFQPTAGIDEVLTASCTIKVTGSVSVSP